MDPLRRRESQHSDIARAFKNDRQTPASCSNIALHNLYPGEIDLVVSRGFARSFLFCYTQAPHSTSS